MEERGWAVREGFLEEEPSGRALGLTEPHSPCPPASPGVGAGPGLAPGHWVLGPGEGRTLRLRHGWAWAARSPSGQLEVDIKSPFHRSREVAQRDSGPTRPVLGGTAGASASSPGPPLPLRPLWRRGRGRGEVLRLEA